MTSDLSYPLIMQSGQLRKLNDSVILRIGTPVFFAAPEPARPRTQSAVGALYEIVTGLYLTYRDYGMKVLMTYLRFCKEHINEYNSFILPHYHSVNKLRGGFCHGMLPGGTHVTSFMREMDYYLPADNEKKWPEFMVEMTEEQCKDVVGTLSRSSNRLVCYIQTCADRIASDEGLLTLWRETLVTRVFNKGIPQYGNSNRPDKYFDERIVLDLEKKIIGTQRAKPHQLTLQVWLANLEPKLLRGAVSGSDELCDSLTQALDRLYSPQVGRSSSDILMGDMEI